MAGYTAHCDGGARGNPGPAGFGAVIENPEGKVVARLSEYLGKQTNNFAEYSGTVGSTRLGSEAWCEAVVRGVRLRADGAPKGAYKVKAPGLRPLWEEAQKRVGKLEDFEMRHTLRGGNKEADKLANQAMDKGQGRRSEGLGNRE